MLVILATREIRQKTCKLQLKVNIGNLILNTFGVEVERKEKWLCSVSVSISFKVMVIQMTKIHKSKKVFVGQTE